MQWIHYVSQWCPLYNQSDSKHSVKQICACTALYVQVSFDEAICMEELTEWPSQAWVNQQRNNWLGMWFEDRIKAFVWHIWLTQA